MKDIKEIEATAKAYAYHFVEQTWGAEPFGEWYYVPQISAFAEGAKWALETLIIKETQEIYGIS